MGNSPLNMPHGNIALPYTDTAWLDAQPAYDTWEGGISRLDLLRLIQQSANYLWKGYAIPAGTDTSFPPLGNFETQISVPPGAWLTMINGHRIAHPENQAPADNSGFMLQVWDTGAKTPFFLRTYAFHSGVTGLYTANMPAGENVPKGGGILESPLVVCRPGQITVQITNLASQTCDIQMLFVFAVPIDPQSMEQQVIREAV